MKASVISAPGVLEVVDQPDPTPAPDEVVIAVAGCGLCGTDLHTLGGHNPLAKLPVTPGHEFAGTVVELGSAVRRLRVGDRVAVDPSRSCEQCALCLSGRANLCRDKGGYGSRFRGGLAERTAVRERNCVVVPDDLELTTAVLAEPLACVLHGIDRLGAVGGRRAVVYGAGPIGVLMARTLRHHGASVSVVELNEQRAARAAAVLGDFADVVGSSDAIALESRDVAVDATGNPAAMGDALGRLDRGGSLLVMGVAAADAVLPISPRDVYARELSILGSMALTLTFERAVALLPRLGVEAVVDQVLPLQDAERWLGQLRHPTGLKVCVSP